MLVDYISYTDKNGLPVGHPLKVLKECGEWIQDNFEIVYAANASYLENLGGEKIELPFKIIEGQDYSSIAGKVRQLFISWINLEKIWLRKDMYHIWFCNIDFFLILFLLCHRCRKKEIIITTYLEKFEKGYQNKLAKFVLPKIKLLITSNKATKYQGSNKFYIPDYLYNHLIYNRYKVEKEDKVVCVGAMGVSKELTELVNAFNRNGCRLQVIGHFSDKNLFDKLKKIANKNIEIEDCYLKYDKYLELLGKAKYCVLPYKVDAYAFKTSGILLESIFLSTIPICNKELLQRWGVSGVGYITIDELGGEEWKSDNESILIENNRLIKEQYSKDVYIRKLMEILQ